MAGGNQAVLDPPPPPPGGTADALPPDAIMVDAVSKRVSDAVSASEPDQAVSEVENPDVAEEFWIPGIPRV